MKSFPLCLKRVLYFLTRWSSLSVLVWSLFFSTVPWTNRHYSLIFMSIFWPSEDTDGLFFFTLWENKIFSSLSKATSLFCHKVVFIKCFCLKFCSFQLYLEKIVFILKSSRQSFDHLKTCMAYFFALLLKIQSFPLCLKQLLYFLTWLSSLIPFALLNKRKLFLFETHNTNTVHGQAVQMYCTPVSVHLYNKSWCRLGLSVPKLA